MVYDYNRVFPGIISYSIYVIYECFCKTDNQTKILKLGSPLTTGYLSAVVEYSTKLKHNDKYVFNGSLWKESKRKTCK